MELLRNEIKVLALQREFFDSASMLERETLGEEAWSSEAIAETVKRNGCYFAAIKDDVFLGHGGFTYAADEGYITNIAVSKEARRQGVATAIIDKMSKKAENLGLSFLSLEVRESNFAAIKLYENCGFSVDGVRPKFYRDPIENAVIMTKRF